MRRAEFGEVFERHIEQVGGATRGNAPLRDGKGHLYEGIVALLETAGYKVRRASDRQYEATISGQPRYHVVFMRPPDIVTQVQEGRCHLGVTGMDVSRLLAEGRGREIAEYCLRDVQATLLLYHIWRERLGGIK